MSETLCPHCQARNPADNRFCGACGGRLAHRSLVLSPDNSITIAGREVPAQQLKRIGASVAVSVAALLAEAAVIWLRHRVQGMEAPKTAAPRSESTALVPTESEELTPVISVYSERVTEIHRWGRPVKRIIERMAWRRDETP